MGLLMPATGSAGYVKAGLLGFQSAGKTYTAVLMALAIRDFYKLDGPLAMFDTEQGSDYISPLVKRVTGEPLLRVKSRALSDLITAAKEAHAAGCAALIGDSMTHVWRELCDSYLREVNSRRNYKRNKLTMEDWGPIKAKWNEWAELFINVPMHVIIAGRAGWDFNEVEEEDGTMRLVKEGVKMKTEGEFGFEPSLLIEMEAVQRLDSTLPQGAQDAGDAKAAGKRKRGTKSKGKIDQKRILAHRATVLKDRFGGEGLNGMQCLFTDARGKERVFDQVLKFFKPHFELLHPADHTKVDTTAKTSFGVDTNGDAQWAREKKQRAIFSEEVRQILAKHIPGQTDKAKNERADLMFKYFSTRSWTAVSKDTSSERLRGGLALMRKDFNIDVPVEPPKPFGIDKDDDLPPDFGATAKPDEAKPTDDAPPAEAEIDEFADADDLEDEETEGAEAAA